MVVEVCAHRAASHFLNLADPVCQSLLEAGADVHAVLKNGMTALHLAVENGHLRCARVSHSMAPESESVI